MKHDVRSERQTQNGISQHRIGRLAAGHVFQMAGRVRVLTHKSPLSFPIAFSLAVRPLLFIAVCASLFVAYLVLFGRRTFYTRMGKHATPVLWL